MGNKKILIIVFGALIIIALILAFLFVRGKTKGDIVLTVGKNMMELNSNKEQNVYIKQIYNGNDYLETYKLNDSVKNIQYYKENGIKVTEINTPTKIIRYIESDDGTRKVMSISTPEEYDNIDELFDNTEKNSYISKFFDTIFMGMSIEISSEVEGKKDCYVIKNKSGSDGSVQYIDKETNLPIKIMDEKGSEITTYEYSFGTVNKDDVAELDTTGFTLLSEEDFENYQVVD